MNSLGRVVVACVLSLLGVSVLAEDDFDTAKELATFQVAEGYEVSLFASEKDGIVNPIQMRWDAEGRLYVISTPLYPQITPGERPNDKIIVLEDTNGDGKADRSTVFADGLFMPEGLEVGDGGVYVGSGNDLLHLKDTNGDGKADQRRIVLTGFGTGDTHQLINNFIWGPSGDLMFCQGLHVFSRVETPWGIERLNNAGVWRLWPRRLKLDPFFGNETNPHNPWGINFDDWGQPILVAGNGHGIYWMTPSMIRGSHRKTLHHLWERDKVCAAEFLGGGHFGDETSNVMVTGSFMNNTVLRFRLEDDQKSMTLKEISPLIVSDDRNFRPVDLRIGPDGALYIADWFNPIIGHYQASYRHPSRDHGHGRIWRVTKKGRRTLPRPKLVGLSVPALLEKLKSPERWVRYQTRRLLQNEKTDVVVPAVKQWVAGLDSTGSGYEQLLYRAIGVCESHEAVVPELLDKLVAAKDPRARAYAARVIGNWHDRLSDPLTSLAHLVQDDNPRVRLEAIVACSYVPTPQAMEVAAMAVDRPMDTYHEHALYHAVHVLGPYWRDAFVAGKIRFDDKPDRLAFVLSADASRDMLGYLKNPKLTGRLGPEIRKELLSELAKVGGPEALRFVLDQPEVDKATLYALAQSWHVRKRRPSGDLSERVKELLLSRDDGLRSSAIRLSGVWGLKDLIDQIEPLARSGNTPERVRHSAIAALTALQGESARALLVELSGPDQPRAMWPTAIASLAELDLEAAATRVAPLVLMATTDEETDVLLAPLLRRKKGAALLAAALEKYEVSEEVAERCRRVVNASAVSDAKLIVYLDRVLGLTYSERAFDPEWIKKLSAEVKADGDPVHGKKVFQSTLLSCASCHSVYGEGAKVGPDLSSIGRGMPVDRIIEDVVWPARQIKEGYVSITITTHKGKIFQGIKVSESPYGLVLRDAVTKKDQDVPWREVDEFHAAGTLMPSGLTSALPRKDLKDLISYLSTLDGSEDRPKEEGSSDEKSDKK